MNTRQMIDEIRSIIAKCNAPEYDVYDALTDEASGWEMRLEELQRERDEEE